MEKKHIEGNIDIPMRFSKHINITKDLVEKYGPTKGCYGCKFAKGEITYIKGHNDACRKRFLEMSETPGDEDLKSKINNRQNSQSIEHLKVYKKIGILTIEHRGPINFSA